MPYSMNDSIGLEIEAEATGSNVVQISAVESKNAIGNFFRHDHDASIESQLFSVPILHSNRALFMTNNAILEKLSLQYNNGVLGTELVLHSPQCLDCDENNSLLETRVGEVLEVLASVGENKENFRAGLHVHVSMPINLRMLKATLRIGAYLEDVFYYLGTQGYTFRGMLKNDSLYCRPITKWGPQCVPSNLQKNAWTQITDIHDLLSATSISDFWWKYGNINTTDRNGVPGGVGRYHPSRYQWLNLYSLLAHGSLEFRIFNTTLEIKKVMACIDFCREVCKYIIMQTFVKNGKELPEHSIFDGRDRNEIIQTFLDFCNERDIKASTIEPLLLNIKNAPDIVIPKYYVASHLRLDSRYEFPNRPHILDSHVVKAKVDDIHARTGG